MHQTISTVLNQFIENGVSKESPEWKNSCFQGLAASEFDSLDKDHSFYQGKVRQCLTLGNELIIFHTDRLTAFDRHIDYVPFKGQILSSISKYWFELAEKSLPTHFLGELNPRTLKVRALTPIKVEVVVRGYLAGSIMRAYEEGRRDFCGVSLPEGLKPYQKLEKPIITPTTKAEAFEHDEETSPEELIGKGICTQQEWKKIEDLAFELFQLGQDTYSAKGWILADTKYEFGKDSQGKIYIIDEIHTPDSSRLWTKRTYPSLAISGSAPEMLDKENVRRYLLSKGFKGTGDVPEVPITELVKLAQTYLQVAETLTGASLLNSSTDNLLAGL